MFIAQADLCVYNTHAGTIQGKRLFVFNTTYVGTREFGAARVICNIFYGRFNRFQLWQIPSRWEFDLLHAILLCAYIYCINVYIIRVSYRLRLVVSLMTLVFSILLSSSSSDSGGSSYTHFNFNYCKSPHNLADKSMLTDFYRMSFHVMILLNSAG